MEAKHISHERYQRQLTLKELGNAGQQKLLQAGVLVIGAGGLGCPVLQYLAAAGIGRLGIVDDDVVAIHNLHRQVLYTTADVGLPKVKVAARRLREMNPDVTIVAYAERLTSQTALSLITDFDIVVDATDNFASRYCINDACVLLNKPLVYGAVSQFEGQVAVFNGRTAEASVNYRDLFPQPPAPGCVLNCAEAGVLGVLPGLIGTLQATEVIKLITGICEPLVNRLFTFNALTNESFVFALSARQETSSALPATANEFAQRNYDWLCETTMPVEELDPAAFDELLRQHTAVIIDVRETGELPAVTEFANRQYPLSTLRNSLPEIDADLVVLFCQSGKRSREAAQLLSEKLGEQKKIYSLKGGILQWKKHGKENA